MIKKLLLPLIALSFVFWSYGCSDNTTEPDDLGNLNLSEEFGGYTAVSETPAFDDPILIEEGIKDTEYDDPMMSTSGVSSLISDPDAGYYHLRMVWGMLRYDSTVTTETDWTGSLTINRGAEIIRRLIHWELNQDFILPRTDRKLIEWISITTVHNDGLAVDIIIPPVCPIFDTTFVTDPSTGDTLDIVVDTTIPEMEPVEVVFETGPYSRTFTLAEIAALDTIVMLDDSNAVAFHGLKIDRRPCPRGFLSGRWGYNDEGEGVFRGVWRGRFGEIAGYFRGIFGVNDIGRRVFVSKWINRNGQFEGFIKGTYNPMPDNNADDMAFERAGGWFRGNIYNAERTAIGVLKGRYKPANDGEGGFLQGRWKINCPEFERRRNSFEYHDYEDGF